jgi:hypothetical protein
LFVVFLATLTAQGPATRPNSVFLPQPLASRRATSFAGKSSPTPGPVPFQPDPAAGTIKITSVGRPIYNFYRTIALSHYRTIAIPVADTISVSLEEVLCIVGCREAQLGCSLKSSCAVTTLPSSRDCTHRNTTISKAVTKSFKTICSVSITIIYYSDAQLRIRTGPSHIVYLRILLAGYHCRIDILPIVNRTLHNILLVIECKLYQPLCDNVRGRCQLGR